MIKLSIIIPIFNVEKYLRRCIESLIAYSSEAIEIILVNDGSPDMSGAICDEYAEKDQRIKVIHKTNGGVSSARNAGIEEAEGNYIWFVDADDWIEQSALENILELIQTNGVDLFIFGFKRIENTGSRKISIVENDINLDTDFNIQYFFRNYYFTYKVGFTPWNKVYRREVIVTNSLRFDWQESFGEDLLFNLQYYLHIKNVYISKKTIYNYFVRDGSLERTPSKERHIQQMRLFKKFIDYTNQKGLGPKSLGDMVSVLFFIHLFSGINQSKASGLQCQEVENFLKKVHQESYYKDIFQEISFYTAFKRWLIIENASVLSRFKFHLFHLFWRYKSFHLAAKVLLK